MVYVRGVPGVIRALGKANRPKPVRDRTATLRRLLIGREINPVWLAVTSLLAYFQLLPCENRATS